MKDKLDITLRIGNVRLSLTVRPEEELLLREAAKEINHAYESYLRRFAGSETDEIMAKVTLLFAKGYLNLSSYAKQTEALLDGFETEIDRLLDTGSPSAGNRQENVG